jgi:ribose transport system substrate-binding protein
MKHTRRTVAAVGVVAVLAMVGCSSSGSGSSSSSGATTGGATSAAATGGASNKAYTFAYANVADSSPLFKLVGDTMVSNGKKVNITVDRFDNNFDPSKALTNAQLMVQEKPDIAIDWTGTESIGKSIGAVFQRANTKCIAVNQQISGCPFFNLVNADLGSGSADIVAPIMKQKGWGAANTTMVLLFNPGAGAEVNSNVRYFYSDIAKQFPAMPQLTPTQITDKTTTIGSLPSAVQLNGQDALQPSYTAMENELQLLPSSRHIVIFTQNDDSATGAWRAITQAGRQSNTLIIGQGADPAALQQLRTNPQWVAEGSVFFELWSEYLLAMGVAIMEGQTPPALTLPPQTVLSKQTVAKYYGASSTTATVAPPLDPRDDYLIKTGILQQFGNIEGLKS